MANPRQFVLVFEAAEKEWYLLTLMCVKGGVDPNSSDYDRRSVMHVAASSGNLRVVQGLLQVGANVNIQDRYRPILSIF
jgi:ankyrin repeat protein